MMDSLRVLIVDDEPLARAKLEHLLADQAGVEVVGEAGEIVEARELLRAERPDLLLLDIQMPGGDGFDLLDQIPAAERPEVVFVTAHDEHAVRAFSVRAVDYLLKPFDRDRLRAAIERGREAIRLRRPEGEAEDRPGNDGSGPGGYISRFVVRGVGRILFIEADSVDWIEAAGNYVRLHHGGENHLLRETMSALEARLDPQRFARIHRSTIVHMDRVKELHHILHGDYSVLLRDGMRLTLSRSYRDRFERLIAKAEPKSQLA